MFSTHVDKNLLRFRVPEVSDRISSSSGDKLTWPLTSSKGNNLKDNFFTEFNEIPTQHLYLENEIKQFASELTAVLWEIIDLG